MFTLVKGGRSAPFVIEADAYEGVRRIAEKVCGDVEMVTGILPELLREPKGASVVLAGTVDKSPLLQRLEEEGKLELSSIRGKYESFIFRIVKEPLPGLDRALVIAGSDKRGTIYGLFQLSERIGVSPWVRFADVKPRKRAEISFSEKDSFVSKEPSVRFRGFFINDEWPAFGNWTFEHFGGFTAQMYDMIFETLLRLKGNYLWPAMWSSSFTLDGPGEENARLADEYGVVMCNSHHEPCLRHSEEWDLVRGEDSIYGNEWNYYTNKEGLLRYWRDGLIRSGKYENVITIGMRGERDSSMLGHDSTLKQNIELLKDIITEQRKLIAEHVNPDPKQVPLMLALYKEVEAYFYGDEETEGLKDWDGLDGVICMLCEDNYGNVRTLPTAQMLDHNGGWGMYYHCDYHGGPISYEWVNSSYLPKMWHHMTQVYEFGVHDLWVVNVGDLKFQEYPLSFFMDLAYDYESWGVSNPQAPEQYMDKWVQREFAGVGVAEQELILQVLKGYTRLNHNRKPEAIQPDTYHPVHYAEAERVLAQSEELERKLEQLRVSLPEEMQPAFWQLLYYPAMGSLNVLQLNLYAGLNHWTADKRAVIANKYADRLKACIERDRNLTDTFHGLLDGKWNGMGLSEHIGFITWNENGCRYPVQMIVEPANKPRLLAYAKGDGSHTVSGDLSYRPIVMRDFAQAGVNEGTLVLLNSGRGQVSYEVLCQAPGIEFSHTAGELTLKDEIVVTVDKSRLQKDSSFTIKYSNGQVRVVIDAAYEALPECPPMTFLETSGVFSIEAEHYAEAHAGKEASMMVMEDYGKTLSGIKALPCTCFSTMEEAPSVTYRLWVETPGTWQAHIYTAPANSVVSGRNLYFGLQVNKQEMERIALLPEGYLAGDPGYLPWCKMVLDQIRIASQPIELHQGLNTLRILALDPGFVLEKIVLAQGEGSSLLPSYLGPEETYYTKG